MLHRTVPTFQRAALRQSSALRHARLHGFRSQPMIRSLHDDSDNLPSSQGPSEGPSEPPANQSFILDKIYVLQSDMATTKSGLNHLKESMNTQMYGLQTSLTGQISALDSKVDAKINALDSKIDTKIDAFRNEMRNNLSELRAELKQHENRLVWRVFFALAGVAAIGIGGAATMFMRDRLLPQQTPHVEKK